MTRRMIYYRVAFAAKGIRSRGAHCRDRPPRPPTTPNKDPKNGPLPSSFQIPAREIRHSQPSLNLSGLRASLRIRGDHPAAPSRASDASFSSVWLADDESLSTVTISTESTLSPSSRSPSFPCATFADGRSRLCWRSEPTQTFSQVKNVSSSACRMGQWREMGDPFKKERCTRRTKRRADVSQKKDVC